MDPFATLGIARSFAVDLPALEKTHRELSRALHPDKFVGAAPTERRAALAKAVEVNEAWRVVRDPIRRAEALFGLEGIATGERNEPSADPEFLMQVMEDREALADAKHAKDLAAIRALAATAEARAQEAEGALAKGFDEALRSRNGNGEGMKDDGARAARDRAALEPLVLRLGELRFHRRFLEEVSAIEDELTTG